jgi:hypothetical protein
MRRICEYFQGQGLKVNYQEYASKLWQTYKYRQIPEFSLENFDEESEADRTYWNTYKD